jgi:PPP family 3-phenylpropionic acid transporter
LVILPWLHPAWLLAAGLAVYAAFSSPLIGLADSATLQLLGGQRERYPRVRAWGSAAFALTSVVGGAVYRGAALWRIFPALGLGLILGALALPRGEPSLPGAVPGKVLPPREGREAFRQLLALRPYVATVGTTFLLQLAVAAHGTFFPMFLVRLNMPRPDLGIPYATAALLEVPMFSLMPRITRWLGLRWTVLISLLAYALRFFLFSILTVAWPVVLVQAMQGITFTFFLGGMVVLAGSLVPPGLKATGQTLFMGVGFSLAAILGNVAGGAVVAALGVFWLYRLASVTALAAAAGFAFTLRPWRPLREAVTGTAL